MPNYKGKRPGTRRIVIWHKGKAHEWVVRGTKKDGDTFEAKKRIELNANEHVHRTVPKFSQLCEEKYRPYAEKVLAKKTWHNRSYVLANLIEFFGDKRLNEFTAGDIDAYRIHRSAAKLNAVTMNIETLTLLYVLRWAKERGYEVNVPKVKLLKEADGRVRIWSPDQIKKLLAVTKTHDPWLYPIVVFLLNTGCRKGEAIAAEWSWMDFDARMIRIPANDFWKPKSGRAREVPMSDAVVSILSGHRRSEQWVFPNRDNARFAVFPNDRFKQVQSLAGVSGGPHTLRHFFASEFLKNRPDMFLLGQVLGHTTQRVTEIYSHLLPGHLELARNAVNIGAPED